jgi:ribosome biogenesis GTPase
MGMDLYELGWNEFFESNFESLKCDGSVPARVIGGNSQSLEVYTTLGAMAAVLAGKVKYAATEKSELPVVGDWVVALPVREERKMVIKSVLPRRSYFSRREPTARGRKLGTLKGDAAQEQVVAANIDTVFIVMGLDNDFNIRRLERYMTLVWDSGANPVIILNKADLCEELEECLSNVCAVAVGVPVHVVSAATGQGLSEIQRYCGKGRTIALVGSSGVGKSTLSNRLLGSHELPTREVRSFDGKGKHTTTWRELVILPGGGMLVDNPGMKELQLWAEEKSVDATFSDIQALAVKCYYRDCSHQGEPNCAVQQALDEGKLSVERFESYVNLRNEANHLSKQLLSKEKIKKQARHKRSRIELSLKTKGKM